MDNLNKLMPAQVEAKDELLDLLLAAKNQGEAGLAHDCLS